MSEQRMPPPRNPAGMGGRPNDPSSSPGQPPLRTGPERIDPGANKGGSLVDQAKDKGGNLMDQAKDQQRQAVDKVESITNQGIDQAANVAQSAADTIREQADRLPGGQRTTEMAENVAHQIERSASYLRQTDAGELQHELENLVRRYPTQSLLAGLAVGFLLARAVR